MSQNQQVVENKKLTPEEIKKHPEYVDAKKYCKDAVRRKGEHSFQVISYSLKILKDKLGEEAVYILADDVKGIHRHVVIPPKPKTTS